MIRYFAYVLLISGVFIPVTCTDISIEEPSDNAFQVLKGENVSEDLINETFLPQVCDCGSHEINCSFNADGEKNCSCEPGFTTLKGICIGLCNVTNPCQNGGKCDGGVCRCPEDYTGAWCETPAWCIMGRCGYDDVECLWDSVLKKGGCRCNKDNYYYLPKDRKCYKCTCGPYGSCQVVDQMMVCLCDKDYALKPSSESVLKPSTCEYCGCGPDSEKCSFDSRGGKVCQCKEKYAQKIASWSPYGDMCYECDCGPQGRCSFQGDEKICDCEDGFRSYGGKCRDCNCGPDGICEFDDFGQKKCSCDYGTADYNGYCRACDCYPEKRGFTGVDCKFEDFEKKCTCPPGFETGPTVFCRDIDECWVENICPANTVCINKPGTYECRCKEGFEPIHLWEDLKLSGCKDIDECLDLPCQSPRVQCVNSPGSYDCVCREGYYSTSGNYGSNYKPEYNTCYEIETQWRQATIALGVIFSIGIIALSYYIRKHKRSP